MMLPLLLATVIAQDAPSPAQRDVEALITMGVRSAEMTRSIAVIDQVVLVPNAATFLDEISRWTPEARWPVLIEDERYAPMFIRRFAPKRIWRRTAGEPLPKDAPGRLAAAERAIAMAWGGEEGEIPEVVYMRRRQAPTGVVLTSMSDDAWPAAVALAAGRGQLLRVLDGDFGAPREILDEPGTARLQARVEAILELTTAPWAEIGDMVDAITVCRSLPSRVALASARDNPVAVTDVIGRDASGRRYAWSGWILGGKVRCAYTAMCSLFLERNLWWAFDTYPQEGGWAQYGLSELPSMLQETGISIVPVTGTLGALRATGTAGLSADFAWITSKGNPDFLDLADARISPAWLPMLDTPAALFFIHSWSLKNPGDRRTAGGIWLDRGVYAYVGSSHEPMLQAFVPPTELVRRTMSLMPLLPASRWFTGQGGMSGPWRINTLGDPLMLACTPAQLPRTHLPPQDRGDAEDLASAAKAAMEAAAADPSDLRFAAAIRLLALLGRDDLARGMWGAAQASRVAGAASAEASLGSLFRGGDVTGFVGAYRLVVHPSTVHKDMLWAATAMDPASAIDVLAESIRVSSALDDLELIAPLVRARWGNSRVRSLIDAVLGRTTGRTKRGLERLLRTYGT